MSLQEVKVSRKDVLEIVQENKKKHDAIFKEAVEGYWLEAEKYLKKYEKDQIAWHEKVHKDGLKKARKALKDCKKQVREQVKKELEFVEKRKKDAPFQYMKNKYPENHTDDYQGTIKRLELCVEDQVELDSIEFDKYVRNKWEWRDSFLSSNTGYVSSYASAVGGLYGAGRYGYSSGITGSTYPISSSWASSSYSADALSTF